MVSNFPDLEEKTQVYVSEKLSKSKANNYIENYTIRFIISLFSFMSRFSYFSAGMLDPSALLYYLSVAGVFLLLTVRVYDKRRWS